MASWIFTTEVGTTEDTEDTEEPGEGNLAAGQFLPTVSVSKVFPFPCPPCLPWFSTSELWFNLRQSKHAGWIESFLAKGRRSNLKAALLPFSCPFVSIRG